MTQSGVETRLEYRSPTEATPTDLLTEKRETESKASTGSAVDSNTTLYTTVSVRESIQHDDY